MTLQQLLDLPDGASYNAHEGQSGIRVEYRNDTVYVYASCDSLQVLLEEYERRVTGLEETATERTKVKEGNILRRATTFTAGLVIILAEILVLTFLKRKKQ